MKAAKTMDQIGSPPLYTHVGEDHVDVEQDCDRQSNAQDVEVPIGGISGRQNDRQHDQPAKRHDAAEGAAEAETEHTANGQDTQANQSDFRSVEARCFRLILFAENLAPDRGLSSSAQACR